MVFDMCQYGQLYKKRTAVMTNMPELHQLERLCTRAHQHQPLRGTVKVVDGGRARYQNRTAVAGTYPPQLGKQCSAPPSAMGETTWRKKRKRPVAMTEQIKALPLATIKSMGTSRRTSAAIPSKKPVVTSMSARSPSAISPGKALIEPKPGPNKPRKQNRVGLGGKLTA